jgi:putative MFS transporter
MTIPITMLFQVARKSLGIENGAIAVGVLCLAIALISLSRLQETFHKDLDYFEEFI